MNTPIDAKALDDLEKAAEAASAIKSELNAMYPISAGYNANEIGLKQMELHSALQEMREPLRDPATVLELVRLARIGEQRDGICKWSEDDEACWDTDCGHSLYFEDGAPAENGVKFCSCCGKPMQQVRVWERWPHLAKEPTA